MQRWYTVLGLFGKIERNEIMYDYGTVLKVNMIIDGERCTFEVGKNYEHPEIKLCEKGEIVKITVHTPDTIERGVVILKLDTKIEVNFFGVFVRILSKDKITMSQHPEVG